MKKKWINYIVLALIMYLSFKVLFGSMNIETFYSTVKMADGRFLLLGIGCMFVYWGLEALMMDNLLKKVNPKMKFWSALKTTIIGQYYSFLTPFASGGQPMQLYELGKDQMPMGSATAVLVSKFLLFQITVTVYSMALFFWRLPKLFVDVQAATTFVLLGLTINVVGLTMIILMAFKPKQVEKIGRFVIEGLSKIKVIKHKEKAYEHLRTLTEEYQLAMRQFHEDIFNTFMLFGLSIVQLTVFFSITYLVYLALGLRGVSFIDIISLQAMLYMAVSFIPSPGTAGASEVGFSLLLGSIFSSHLLAMAILLWRGISYYFGLIFCGLFTLYVYLSDKRKAVSQTG
jgi:hypothetical protein